MHAAPDGCGEELKLKERLAQFMQGRYGIDDLGRALFTAVMVLIMIGVVADLFTNVLGAMAQLVGSFFNFVACVVLVVAAARALSRNVDKRRDENMRYARWRNERAQSQQRAQRGAGGSGPVGSTGRAGAASGSTDAVQASYAFLACQHCGQEMRVPANKGTIAVRCPSCGEKTITRT